MNQIRYVVLLLKLLSLHLETESTSGFQPESVRQCRYHDDSQSAPSFVAMLPVSRDAIGWLAGCRGIFCQRFPKYGHPCHVTIVLILPTRWPIVVLSTTRATPHVTMETKCSRCCLWEKNETNIWNCFVRQMRSHSLSGRSSVGYIQVLNYDGQGIGSVPMLKAGSQKGQRVA